MKRSPLLAAAAAALLTAAPAHAQLSAFGFDTGRVPVGQVFHFVKSQLDGSHEARISVYVAAPDRLEALKWDRGGEEATLVVAEMDWSRFSVRRFAAKHLTRGAAPEPRAAVDVDASGTLRMSLMPEPLPLTHFPWHSYDFDFTSLNFSLPHLREPESGVSIWRTDFVYSDPPKVAELGEVTLRFERVEERAGRRARRYSIGGPGLAGKSGTWWADAATGLLVEYELLIGDEPGYDSVRLLAAGAEKLDAVGWQAFKDASVAGRP